MDWLKARLRESATWRGIIWIIAGVAGLQLSEADALSLGAIVAGAVGALLPEKH